MPPPCPNCGKPLYYNTNGFHACAPSITVDTVLAVGRLTDERDALRAEVERLRAGLEECFGTSCDWCDHLSAAGCCRKQYKHPCRSKVVRAHTMRIFFRLGDRAPQNAALEVSTDGTEPSE